MGKSDNYYQSMEKVTEEVYARVHMETYKPFFSGLGFNDMIPKEVEGGLDTYVHVRFVRPTLVPTLAMAIAPASKAEKAVKPKLIGRVVASKVTDASLTYPVVGNAQSWLGSGNAVLWECFSHHKDEGLVKTLWDWFESYLQGLGVKQVFTHDHDPAFEEEWYKCFLAGRGYKHYSTYGKSVTLTKRF